MFLDELRGVKRRDSNPGGAWGHRGFRQAFPFFCTRKPSVHVCFVKDEKSETHRDKLSAVGFFLLKEERVCKRLYFMIH